MSGDRFEVSLGLPDVRIVRTELSPSGQWLITVESTQDGTQCRRCGRRIVDVHGLDDPIELRHLPILGQDVFLRIRPKRYRCRFCSGEPTTTQRLSWYDPRSTVTRAYAQSLLRLLIGSTIEEVCRKERVSPKTVTGVLEQQIAIEVDWNDFASLEILGLDEVAIKKGHRDFVTIVTTRMASGPVRIVAVLEDRTKETVKAFLRSIPDGLKATISTVCMDLYEGFVNAVKEELSDARPVIDRFHVAKLYREAADTVRKQEQARLRRELSEEAYKELCGTMWAFRKDPEQLSVHEHKVLDRFFEHAPKAQQAYQLERKLTAIFEQPLSKEAAKKQFQDWQQEIRESGLKCFDTFIGTMNRHMEGITNYFVDRHTSGFVEGFNNRIKALARRCYGLFKPSKLFQRLRLDTEGYRLFGPAPVCHTNAS
jgi:transposase